MEVLQGAVALADGRTHRPDDDGFADLTHQAAPLELAVERRGTYRSVTTPTTTVCPGRGTVNRGSGQERVAGILRQHRFRDAGGTV